MKKQQITNNIKVPNKNLEILKQNFSHCFDKEGNFDFEKFKQELILNEDLDFSNESYGMDWLGKSYARLLASDEATTLLKENEEWNRKPENESSENLLIKGDNLEVLKHLSNAYYEKIKMIYIDPPYNTGGDGFVYQDDRKFTVEELSRLAGIDEEKAKRILEFTQSKSNSHSAWLTFMYPRLYIAKQLLKDDGVIFVSIDDNEVAQLRLLMDEIFGEENFVGNLIWLNQEGGGGSDSKHFRIKHEHVLCFSKKFEELKVNGIEINNRERYTESDEFQNKRGNYYLQKLGMGSIQYSSSLDYKIKTPDGNYVFPKDNNNGKKACWRWSESKLEWGKKNGFIQFKKDKKGIWNVYTKQYMNCDNEGNYIERLNRPMGIIEKFSSTQASKKIQDLFDGKKVFSYPKPYDLISYLISLSTNKNDIILDFFAGSGTTGDAVMQLNAEDGGNRKYILVQLPEIIDPKKNKIAYDFVKNSPLEGWTAEQDGVESSPLEGWTAKQDGVESSPLEGWQSERIDGVDKQSKSLFPYWTLPKNKDLTQRARELRKQGILSEVLFWKAFKDKEKIKGYDIDRQVIIGNFIVDFFIAELGLVIEIDGSSHDNKQEYDKERENFFLGLNLKVIRYTDNEVKKNIDGIYKDFLDKIEVREQKLSAIVFKGATPQEGKNPPRPLGTPQEGKNPPRPLGTPQEGRIHPALWAPLKRGRGNLLFLILPKKGL